MIIYRVEVYVGDEGDGPDTYKSLWFPNKKLAQERAREEEELNKNRAIPVYGEVQVHVHNVPTDKRGLINFLNTWACY